MGLDITAYEHVTLVEAITGEKLKEMKWEHPLYDRDDHEFLYVVYEDHRERFDDLVEGFYKPSGAVLRFRAGSYGGYNHWREKLAKMIGTTPQDLWNENDSAAARSTPFYELICFSDCDGVIGPKTSAKLYADFKEHRNKAGKAPESGYHDDDTYFASLYVQWMNAFDLASRGGVVRFH